MSQPEGAAPVWEKPRQAMQEVRSLIAQEHFETALQKARAGCGLFPQSRPLALARADLEFRQGSTFEQAFSAWTACIRLHGGQSRPNWIRKLVRLVDAEFGSPRVTRRGDAHAAAVAEIEALAKLVWSSDADSSSGEGPLNRHKAAVLRYLIRFHHNRFEFENSSHFERALFALPHACLAPKDFLAAMNKRVKYSDLECSLRESDLLAWGRSAYPVGDLSLGGSDEDSAARRQNAEAFHLRLAEWMADRGRFREANEILVSVPPEARLGDRIAEIRSRMQPAGFRAIRADVVSPWGDDVAEADFLIARNDRPNGTVVLVFSGGIQLINLMTASIHPLLKAAGCHVIYVLDSRQKHFMKGVHWQRPGALVALLDSAVSDLHGDRVLTMGWSSGGGAALWLGKTMGAQKVLAFSPVIIGGDARFEASRIAYEEAAREDPDCNVNIEDLYGVGDNPRTEMYVGAESPGDVAFAEKIENMANVTLERLPGVRDHSSVRWVMAHDMMPAILARFLDSDNGATP